MCSSQRRTGNSSENVHVSFAFEQKYNFFFCEYLSFEPHQGHRSKGILVLFSPSSRRSHFMDSSSSPSFPSTLFGRELEPTYKPIEIGFAPKSNSSFFLPHLRICSKAKMSRNAL